MLTEALTALEAWSVAATIRRSLVIYPLINATHILSIGLLVGGILPADLRMLGFFRSVAAPPFLRLMTGVAGIGLALAITTGVLLFSVQPLEYAGNPAFLAKVTLVATGVVLALAIRFSPAWRLALATGEATPTLRGAALASIAIWLSALLAGRWIAFV